MRDFDECVNCRNVIARCENVSYVLKPHEKGCHYKGYVHTSSRSHFCIGKVPSSRERHWVAQPGTPGRHRR